MAKIKEIMRRYVVTVAPKTSITEAAKVMANNRIGSVIVIENAKPVNIVTADDIVDLVARGRSPKTTKVKDFRKRKLITATPEDDIIKVSRKMLKAGIKRVPVLQGGKLVGIVSDKEIMLAAPEMLEIVSERLRARVSAVAPVPGEELSGLCERCESYSDNLLSVGGRWLCEDCRELEGE